MSYASNLAALRKKETDRKAKLQKEAQARTAARKARAKASKMREAHGTTSPKASGPTAGRKTSALRTLRKSTPAKKSGGFAKAVAKVNARTGGKTVASMKPTPRKGIKKGGSSGYRGGRP